MIITRAELKQMLVPGTIARVEFYKRSDGSFRVMHAKVEDGNPTTDRNGLVLVTDLELSEYRSIPLDGVVALRLAGHGHWLAVEG